MRQRGPGSCSSPRGAPRRIPWPLALPLAVLLAGSQTAGPLAAGPAEKGKAGAQDRTGEKRPSLSLNGWGRLGSAVKGTGDFFQFTSYEKAGGGKVVSVKCLLQVPPEASVQVDQPIRIEDLAVDEEVYILGRVVSHEVPGRGGGVGGGGIGGGRGGRDRQIQNARAVVTGKDMEVQMGYRDPSDKSLKWLKASVVNSASGLWVKYEGEDHRVTLDKAAPILRRGAADRKLLRSGAYLLAVGQSTDPPAEEPPKTGTTDATKGKDIPKAKDATQAKDTAKAKDATQAKDAVTPATKLKPQEKATTQKSEKEKKAVDDRIAYQARRVVILDPRYLKTAYAAILP